MKSFWLLLLLFLPAPVRASQDLLPELVRRIKPSAVAIETFYARGEKYRSFDRLPSSSERAPTMTPVYGSLSAIGSYADVPLTSGSFALAT